MVEHDHPKPTLDETCVNKSKHYPYLDQHVWWMIDVDAEEQAQMYPQGQDEHETTEYPCLHVHQYMI